MNSAEKVMNPEAKTPRIDVLGNKMSERTFDTPATSSRNIAQPNNIEIVINDSQKRNFD